MVILGYLAFLYGRHQNRTAKEREDMVYDLVENIIGKISKCAGHVGKIIRLVATNHYSCNVDIYRYTRVLKSETVNMSLITNSHLLWVPEKR